MFIVEMLAYDTFQDIKINVDLVQAKDIIDVGIHDTIIRLHLDIITIRTICNCLHIDLFYTCSIYY